MTVTAFEQDVGGWVAHEFRNRSEVAAWCKRNPGVTLLPDADMVRGRFFGTEDHRNDWMIYALEDDESEEDEMYQQPLFIDVHQVKEGAQASTETQAPSPELILPDDIDSVYEDFKASCSESMLRRFNGRLERALLMAKEGKVRFTDIDGVYEVASQKVKGTTYVADIRGKTCNCPDADAGNVCKHRMAAWFVEQVVFQQDTSPITPEEISEDPVSLPERGDPDSGRAGRETLDKALDEVFSRLVFHRVCPRVIWAMLDYEGLLVPVEIQEFNGDKVFVQALPNLIDGKFVPNFPFKSEFGTDVPVSSTWTDKEQLSCVKIYGGDHEP